MYIKQDLREDFDHSLLGTTERNIIDEDGELRSNSISKSY